MRKSPIALVLALVLTLCSCSFLVREPTVVVRDISLVGLDTGGIEAEFYLAITNPNSFSVRLKGYTYDLQVMALPLARGGMRTDYEFGKKSTTELRIPVKIAYRDLLGILKRRPDLDRIPYRLKAGFELDTPAGLYAVPLDTASTFTLPKECRPGSFLKRVLGFFNYSTSH